LVDTFFFGKFLFYEKNNPTVCLPFLFIKYSKTTYQKHHLHVNIQKLKK
jgi:hypothetical protein